MAFTIFWYVVSRRHPHVVASCDITSNFNLRKHGDGPHLVVNV